MTPPRAKEGKWEKWAPFVLTLVVQLLAMVWFASNLNATTQRNSQDIVELRAIVVPRAEITSQQSDVKDRLDDVNRKLDLLIARKANEQ